MIKRILNYLISPRRMPDNKIKKFVNLPYDSNISTNVYSWINESKDMLAHFLQKQNLQADFFEAEKAIGEKNYMVNLSNNADNDNVAVRLINKKLKSSMIGTFGGVKRGYFIQNMYKTIGDLAKILNK